MKIRYIGHSCFVLESVCGTRLVTDPYDGIGIPMPKLKADGVTLSHSHFDHNNVSAVCTDTVLSACGEFTVKDIYMKAIPSFHDEAGGAKRGSNLIFKFVIDGVTVVHLGDLGESISHSRIQAIGHTDVLLLPVGGNYTISATEAKKYADAIQPKVIIPMHYKAQGITINIAPLSEFIQLFEKEQIKLCGSEAEFMQDSFPHEQKVLILEGDHE